MVQELIDLRKNIIEGNYADALIIIDELELISKQAIYRKIESFLQIILINLIKNQVEKTLTNSLMASISYSLVQIKKLNLQHDKNYYINEWNEILTEEIEIAINSATVEVLGGSLNPFQLCDLIARDKIIIIARQLLDLTFHYSKKDLPMKINQNIVDLLEGKMSF